MSDAIINAISVLLIIAIAYSLKRMKVFSIEIARKLAIVVMYLTLPCAILTSANGMSFDLSLFSVMFISIGANLILMLVAFFSSRDVEKRMFNMLNCTAHNIGNFIIPFMQHSMSPRAFLALCMFDVVNALFCFGGSYSLALFMNRKYFPHLKITYKTILKEMSKSLPFYVYVLVISVSAMGLTIPSQVLAPFETIGNANTFLCFTIIGIGLAFNITFEQFKHVMQTFALRYLVSFALAAGVWFFIPLDAEVRIILMIILLAPATSIAPIMTMKALPKYTEVSADLNTISIIASLGFVTLMTSISTYLV